MLTNLFESGKWWLSRVCGKRTNRNHSRQQRSAYGKELKVIKRSGFTAMSCGEEVIDKEID